MSRHLGILTLHIYEYSQKSYTINPSYNIIELLRKFSQGNAFMGQIQIFVTQIFISSKKTYHNLLSELPNSWTPGIVWAWISGLSH